LDVESISLDAMIVQFIYRYFIFYSVLGNNQHNLTFLVAYPVENRLLSIIQVIISIIEANMQ